MNKRHLKGPNEFISFWYSPPQWWLKYKVFSCFSERHKALLLNKVMQIWYILLKIANSQNGVMCDFSRWTIFASTYVHMLASHFITTHSQNVLLSQWYIKTLLSTFCLSKLKLVHKVFVFEINTFSPFSR